MVAGPCTVQHVDGAIVKDILRRGTKTSHHNDNISDEWNPRAIEWYSSILQTACHLGGSGVTPNSASGIFAYYSATEHYKCTSPG